MAYAVRQWLELLLNPLAVALLLALAGGVSRALRHRRAAHVLFGAAAVIAYFGTIPLVANLLIGPLERRYPPLHTGLQPLSARYVVVLGSGFAPYDDIPVTAALDSDGLSRIVEAVRL